MKYRLRWHAPFFHRSAVWTGGGMVVLAAGLFGLGAPLRAAFSGPETCAACHPQEYDEWKPSVHAAAYAAPGFQKVWKQNGSKDRKSVETERIEAFLSRLPLHRGQGGGFRLSGGHLRVLPWGHGGGASGGQDADARFLRHVPDVPQKIF